MFQDLPLEFIELERRKVKQQFEKPKKALNENENKKVKTKLKGWKLLGNGGYDHQFFDSEALDALEQKESAWKDYCQQDEQADCSVPEEFTFVDAAQKQKLLSAGFAQWTRNDYFNFVKMATTFGRKEATLGNYQ